MELLEFMQNHELIGNNTFSADLLTVKEYADQEEIVDCIHNEEAIGFVMDGMVEVHAMSFDGKEVHLNTLKCGDCFGISNLFTIQSMKTSLFAKGNTKIAYLLKKQFLAKMECDASFSMRYAKYCSQKIEFLLERIQFLTMQSAKSKLILYLLAHIAEDNQVCLDCKRDELASRLGVSRAALFRELSELQKQNIIRITKKDIIIENMESLKAFPWILKNERETL